MPHTFLLKDFSAGWIPSDDALSGRKNGLLSMDNLELDRNGSLTLVGGTSVVSGGDYPANANRLYSRSIGGSRYDYLSDVSGGIWRNHQQIAVGGDPSNTAFGTAFDFTLIASGAVKKKDNINFLYNLGIAPPTAAPTVTNNNTPAFHANFISPGVPFNTPVFTSIYGTVAFPGDSTGAHFTLAETPVGSKIYLGAYQSGADAGVPWDMTDMYNPRVTPPDQHGYMTDQDMMVINITAPGYANPIASLLGLKIDFLTVPPSGVTVASDFYTYGWTNDGSYQGDSLNLIIRREDFEKVGAGGGQSYWSTVYGVRISILAAANIVYIMGTDLNPLYVGGTVTLHFNGGTKQSIQGTNIQYASMNVFNTGSYLAKSTLGPPTPVLAADMNYFTITPQPSTDSSANETWIFRRGGELDNWYRVLRLTGFNFGTGNDYFGDLDAIGLDIIYNPNLISTASIPERILDIVGPIEGRWYYFTTNFMYPSDINCPDLVDASIAVRTTGSSSEIFLWARKISDAAVLVGTNIDIYILTGTFQTLPDFSIDIYYKSTGCRYPPISYDCTVFEGTAYYLAADGWRIATPSIFSQTYGGGANSTLVVPNVDRLYRGITCYGYVAPNLNIQSGAVRFPVVVAKNKLWCCMTGTNRIEVFDFSRKYWRVVSYDGLGDVTAITNTQDGQILAFFNNDNTLRIIDNERLPLSIDGSKPITVNIFTPIFDGPLESPMPRNRKDLYTLKARLSTGGGALSLAILDDKGRSFPLGTLSSSGTADTEVILDIANKVATSKFFQIQATGRFNVFNLSDFSVEFDARPSPLTFLRLYNSNFGVAAKKRLRVWPQVIDTLGNVVTFTPYVDNVPAASTNMSTPDKNTVLTFFKTDVFGVDYGGTFSGGPFEFWESVAPDIVQVLPIARQYDQVGPHEFFRYGRVKQFELRVLPFGPGATSLLPWKFLFNDNSVLTGNITVTNNEEHSYFIGVPKGTAGTIIRIEFGPTAYNFHRYYVRMQVLPSGQDTELQWIDLPEGR